MQRVVIFISHPRKFSGRFRGEKNDPYPRYTPFMGPGQRVVVPFFCKKQGKKVPNLLPQSYFHTLREFLFMG